MSHSCYHCGEEIPKGIELSVDILNKTRDMCCIGCQSIAQTIIDNGLTEYYQFRTEPAVKGSELIPEQLKKNKLLDDNNLQSEFTFSHEDHKEAILTVEGISCAACAWLIEMQLSKVEGVISINVNATTQRATVQWQSETISLSEILNAVEKIGYHALPFKASAVEESNKKQLKVFIKRLGISGILMMQVMMIAVGLYFGAFSDMADHNLVYLRWTSFIMTIPIVTYGAFPFYTGAINAIRSKRLSMDVPVSIAIFLAFIASAWATISQQGEVYFESVSMFTFLLLIGKFLEFRARARAAEVSANLLKLMPMTATKMVEDKEEFVVAKSLKSKDVVIIKPGETVPADGIIIEGRSQLNEAMLSGEQKPITKSTGETVYAGTINGDGIILVEVVHDSNHSFLYQLIKLSESSQSHKPKIAKLSDKIAQYFVAIILVTAICTALYWHNHMPEEAFWITLSVLVATCPCALSLATPTALTCGTTRLNNGGIMIKSAHVLETIPAITTIAFDKTGTITKGEFDIHKIDLIDASYTEEQVLALASALESYSEHPLAKPFRSYRDYSLSCEKVKVHPGAGIEASIGDNNYKIGKASWLIQDKEKLNCAKDSQCVLVKNDTLIAIFYLSDKLRDDAISVFKYLDDNQINKLILSGDSASGCAQVAEHLGLKEIHSALSAEQKMKIIMDKQKSETVAMVGDGVNDAPVFGAAHVSIAMGSGTDIAKNGADVVLLNNQLSTLKTLKEVASKTKKIIVQNYLWAFGYNAIILPLAVTGHVTPYMAVIGMSASSILVITNSLRLLKK